MSKSGTMRVMSLACWRANCHCQAHFLGARANVAYYFARDRFERQSEVQGWSERVWGFLWR